MSCRRARRTEEEALRLVSGDLGWLSWWRLRRHGASCPHCQRIMDEVWLTERVLAGGSLVEPSPGEVEAGWARFARRLPDPGEGEARLGRRGVGRLAWGGAALAMVVVALLVVPGMEPELTSKGVSLHGRGRQGEVGFRAFALAPEGGVEAVGELHPGSTLPREGVLKLAVTNRRSATMYAFLFGIDGQGRIKWYLPRPEDGQSLAIPPGWVDHPVGHGLRVAVNHEPGLLLLVGLFSAAPLRVDEVRQWVQGRSIDGETIQELWPAVESRALSVRVE